MSDKKEFTLTKSFDGFYTLQVGSHRIYIQPTAAQIIEQLQEENESLKEQLKSADNHFSTACDEDKNKES